jgi:hypothetical protein
MGATTVASGIELMVGMVFDIPRPKTGSYGSSTASSSSNASKSEMLVSPSAAVLLSLRRRIITGPELLSRWAEVLFRRKRFGIPCAPRLTRRINPGPFPKASAIAEGDEVGGDWNDCNVGGGRSDSGRVYEGIAGSDDEHGTMPSGVDCSEPLRLLHGASAGLPRAGMVMARPKLGDGEGMRGRECASWCSRDMLVVVETIAEFWSVLVILHSANKPTVKGA